MTTKNDRAAQMQAAEQKARTRMAPFQAPVTHLVNALATLLAAMQVTQISFQVPMQDKSVFHINVERRQPKIAMPTKSGQIILPPGRG